MVKEKDIEKYLVDQVRKIGGICWKFVSPGTAGVPDRIIHYRGITWYVELKRPGETPRALQIHRLHQLDDQGIPTSVIDSKERVDELVERLKIWSCHYLKEFYERN